MTYIVMADDARHDGAVIHHITQHLHSRGRIYLQHTQVCPYTVLAYIGMAYVVIAYTVVPYIVMVYVVVDQTCGSMTRQTGTDGQVARRKRARADVRMRRFAPRPRSRDVSGVAPQKSPERNSRADRQTVARHD